MCARALSRARANLIKLEEICGFTRSCTGLEWMAKRILVIHSSLASIRRASVCVAARLAPPSSKCCQLTHSLSLIFTKLQLKNPGSPAEDQCHRRHIPQAPQQGQHLCAPTLERGPKGRAPTLGRSSVAAERRLLCALQRNCFLLRSASHRIERRNRRRLQRSKQHQRPAPIREPATS